MFPVPLSNVWTHLSEGGLCRYVETKHRSFACRTVSLVVRGSRDMAKMTVDAVLHCNILTNDCIALQQCCVVLPASDLCFLLVCLCVQTPKQINRQFGCETASTHIVCFRQLHGEYIVYCLASCWQPKCSHSADLWRPVAVPSSSWHCTVKPKE